MSGKDGVRYFFIIVANAIAAVAIAIVVSVLIVGLALSCDNYGAEDVLVGKVTIVSLPMTGSGDGWRKFQVGQECELYETQSKRNSYGYTIKPIGED